MAALEKARTSALSPPTPKEAGDVDVDVDADWENDTVSTSDDVAKASRDASASPPPKARAAPPPSPAALEPADELPRAATLVMEVPVPGAPVEPEEEEEEDADRAYVAPRSVPVAAMPAKEHEEARVVLNIPSSKMDEEVTQAIDKDALDRMRAKERARRREPTVRIPRQEIEAVRAALDAAEAANTGAEVAPFFVPPPAPAFSDVPATSPTPKSDPPLSPTMTDASEAFGAADVASPSGPAKSGRLTMALVAMLCVGAISGVTYFVTQMRPATPKASNAAPAEPLPTTKPSPAKVEAAPPVATEALPTPDPMPVTSVADPSVVELDKAAANTPTQPPVTPQVSVRPRLPATTPTATPRPQPKPVLTPTVQTGKYVPQGI